MTISAAIGGGRSTESKDTPMPLVERSTIGDIHRAITAAGSDPDLFLRLLEGRKCALYEVCSLLVPNAQDCEQCPERAECHRTLAV